MTSKVTGTAHCGSNKRLRMTTKNTATHEPIGGPVDLKDGESYTLYAYDTQYIVAEEVEVAEESRPIETTDVADAGYSQD